MDLKEKVSVMHCSGVEGPSLYINNFRVCGPKPWGGGSVVKEWKDAETGDILRALGDDYLRAANSHDDLLHALKVAEAVLSDIFNRESQHSFHGQRVRADISDNLKFIQEQIQKAEAQP